MKRINEIILHCSDSLWGSASEIRRWHLSNGWKDIGYHFVGTNGFVRPQFYIPEMDGSLEVGRYLDGDNFISDNEIGAHTLGYNATSVGYCLIGKEKFTEPQFWKAKRTIEFLLLKYNLKTSDVYGHYEKQKGRTCPNVDMDWFRGVLFKEELLGGFKLEKYWTKTLKVD